MDVAPIDSMNSLSTMVQTESQIDRSGAINGQSKDSPSTRVFTIHELFEAIIVNLSPHALLRLQRTNRTFHSAITTSPDIRQIFSISLPRERTPPICKQPGPRTFMPIVPALFEFIWIERTKNNNFMGTAWFRVRELENPKWEEAGSWKCWPAFTSNCSFVELQVDGEEGSRSDDRTCTFCGPIFTCESTDGGVTLGQLLKTAREMRELTENKAVLNMDILCRATFDAAGKPVQDRGRSQWI